MLNRSKIRESEFSTKNELCILQSSFFVERVIIYFPNLENEGLPVLLLRIFDIPNLTCLHGHNRFAFTIKQHGKTSTISTAVIEIVYTSFSIHPYLCRIHRTLRESLNESLFLFCHIILLEVISLSPLLHDIYKTSRGRLFDEHDRDTENTNDCT